MLTISDMPFLQKKSNLVNQKTSGIDHPMHCLLGKHWWYNYEHFDLINYNYNSHGFRESNFVANTKVSLCLGDSFTVNLGGAEQHGWVRQIEKFSDQKCVNLGINGAGNDLISIVALRACDYFSVDKIYVIFSFLHRYVSQSSQLIQQYSDCVNDSENFKRFEKSFNALENLYPEFRFSFLPGTCYTASEKNFLSQYKKLPGFVQYLDCKYGPLYKDYFNIVDIDRKKHTDKNIYNIYRSKNWPTYTQWINGASPHEDMFTEKFGSFLSKTTINDWLVRHFNRDGWHFSEYTNKEIAQAMLK